MESQNGQITHTAAQNQLPVALEKYAMIVRFIRSTMQPGIDFGTIPGTGDRPTLLLPGAQKIAALFRFGTRLTLDKELEDWTGDTHKGEPFFMYRHLCEVFDQHGQLVATGYGSCNSWEKKYRFRESKRRCPRCESEAIRKGKNAGEGFYCWGKIGGCGAKFADNDPGIIGQRVGLEPNPEIFDQTNTLLKMSSKRAYVCGILYAAGIAEFFTQDTFEDMGTTSNSGKSAPAN